MPPGPACDVAGREYTQVRHCFDFIQSISILSVTLSCFVFNLESQRRHFPLDLIHSIGTVVLPFRPGKPIFYAQTVHRHLFGTVSRIPIGKTLDILLNE